MDAVSSLLVEARKRKFERYLKYLKWLAVVASFVTAVALDRTHLGQTAHDLYRTSIVLLAILSVAETIWIGGLLMMIVGFGINFVHLLKTAGSIEKWNVKTIVERAGPVKPN